MDKAISLILIVMAFASCQNPKDKKVNNLPTDKTKVEISIKTTQYQTQSGKQFIIYADYSQGASICDLKVETKNFAKNNSVHSFGLADPIKDIFIIDLDKNGFEEIYIVTTSAGSGSYSTIYGLASNRDRSCYPYLCPDSFKSATRPGRHI